VTPGDRVRVAIRNVASWHRGGEAFDGALGTVEDVSLNEIQGNPRPVPYVLVRFDEPIETPLGPCVRHHFDATELKVAP
jgi:hypothetical protein